MKIHSRAVLSLFSLFIFSIILLPFSASGQADGSSGPINIEADRMVSQEEENSVVFLGNVVATQDDLVIRTDEMTVYYVQDESSAENKKSQVKKLICKGNVEISQGDWIGTGKRMDYYAKDRKVILSDNAKAWKGQNMVSGKTITYYLDEGRSVVEGPAKATGNKGKKPERVKAVIHPDSDSK